MITSNYHGGYHVKVPVPGSPLSALVLSGYAFTLWGAKRMDARLTRQAAAFQRARNSLHPNCRCNA